MVRRMPVPLVPGSRGRATLDAELPPLSREELEAILELVGGGPGGTPPYDKAEATCTGEGTCSVCEEGKKETDASQVYSACSD